MARTLLQSEFFSSKRSSLLLLYFTSCCKATVRKNFFIKTVKLIVGLLNFMLQCHCAKKLYHQNGLTFLQEGNLPNNSKCVKCRKACWSAECLTGMRCQWCGMTVSAKALTQGDKIWRNFSTFAKHITTLA